MRKKKLSLVQATADMQTAIAKLLLPKKVVSRPKKRKKYKMRCTMKKGTRRNSTSTSKTTKRTLMTMSLWRRSTSTR